MEAYLLDTNAASALWDEQCPCHEQARDCLEQLGRNGVIYISRIVAAEVFYGHKLFLASDERRRKIIEEKLAAFELVKEIGRHTVDPYASIRAKLFTQYGTRDAKNQMKRKRPEQLLDATTATTLQIQENDLWTAAIALEHNMILISDDRMTAICSVEPELRLQTWKR